MEILNIKYYFNRKYIPKVAKLEQELWNMNEVNDYIISIKKALNKKNYTIFLAIENEIPLGYIETDIFHSWDENYSISPILKICGLYVATIARNKGIASSLIAEVEKYAKSLGCKQIASDYYSFNTESKNLHNKLGFKQTSTIINVVKNI